MIARPILLITGFFIAGIILQYWTNVPGVILLTLWLSSIIATLTAIVQRKAQLPFHKLIGALILITFFFSGQLSYGIRSASFFKNHYANHVLPGDLLVLEVVETSEGKMNKAILEVRGVAHKMSYTPTVGKLLVYTHSSVQVGDIYVTGLSPQSIINANNPGEFDAAFFWKIKGIHQLLFTSDQTWKKISESPTVSGLFNRIRGYFKRQIHKSLPDDLAPVAVALSLGDKSALSMEQRSSFANAGAMHVLAVSGLHVGILLAILQWMFYQIPVLRKRNVYVICALLIIWGFALLTGLAPSVFRATLMFTILGVGFLLGKRFFSLNAVFVSALLILMLDGSALFDIGFQLSYLAILGISLFFQPVQSLLTLPYKWMRYVWDGVAVGVAAQIGTLPISLFYFHQFPNYFILTNIGLILLSGIALGSVLLFLVTHAIPYLSDVTAYIVEVIFRAMLIFINWIDSLPNAVSRGLMISGMEVVVVYGLIGAVYWFMKSGHFKGWRIAAGSILVMSIYIVFLKTNTHQLSEMVVFNHKQPLILIRENGINHVVYTDDSEFKKMEVLLQNYQQLYEGEFVYHLLALDTGLEISSNEFTLIITHAMSKITIDAGEKIYGIPLNSNFNVSPNEQMIFGKWLGKKVGENGYQLTDGAYRTAEFSNWMSKTDELN